MIKHLLPNIYLSYVKTRKNNHFNLKKSLLQVQNNTWRDSIVIYEERYNEVLEILEPEWANETYEQTMSIFYPSEDYLKLNNGNKSPNSNEEN